MNSCSRQRAWCLTKAPSHVVKLLCQHSGGIPKDRRSRRSRRDLLEQFQPFRANAVFEIRWRDGDCDPGADPGSECAH